MSTEVTKKLVKAIEVLADKVVNGDLTGPVSMDEALKYTQAALHAAHTIQVLDLVSLA